jgi:toxin ParE1/3/4
VKDEFLPAAEDELFEVSGQYESRLKSLGFEFIAEAERVVARLADFHLLGERIDPRHRRIPLQRFPYALIYRVDTDAIRVVAVAHHRRRPRYWRPRVQDASAMNPLISA